MTDSIVSDKIKLYIISHLPNVQGPLETLF